MQNSDQKSQTKKIETLTVLVFEDNELNQWLIKKRLKHWGCTFFITDDAEKGMNILIENHVDVVFMDLRMPVVDGFEITKRIRSLDDKRISEVPIIALTADFTGKVKELAYKLGINDYMLKPYTQDNLYKILMQYGIEPSKAVELDPNEVISQNKDDKSISQVDLTPVLEDCMGELDMLEELLKLFKQNVLEFIGKGKLHLKNRDYDQLQFATHKMKSGLAMMQTQNLLILVQQMHEHCKTDRNHDQMFFLYNQFIKEYPTVEFALDREFLRLKKEQ